MKRRQSKHITEEGFINIRFVNIIIYIVIL